MLHLSSSSCWKAAMPVPERTYWASGCSGMCAAAVASDASTCVVKHPVALCCHSCTHCATVWQTVAAMGECPAGNS